MSEDTQKNKKMENLIKRVMRMVGPEYPGEGAMSKIIIAGFTAVEDLLEKTLS